MKKLIISASLIACLTLGVGCGENQSAKENVDEAVTKAKEAGEKVGDKVSEAANKVGDKVDNLTDGRDTGMAMDKEFVMEAASGGLMEVQAGKLAGAKGTSAKVKEFGRMMVTDHTKANAELKIVAAKKNISLPTTLMEEHQKHIDMLTSKKGAEFDKEYINLMVDDHQEDVDNFTTEANKGNDAVIKAFAAKTLPVLNKHLQHVKMVNETMDKQK